MASTSLADDLSIDQRLLVAQAVHSVRPLGPVDHTVDWERAVGLLQKHAADTQLQFKSPLMLDPRACSSAYSDLCQRYLGAPSALSEPPSTLALAHKLYEVRINGIGEALAAEQQRFKTIASEIEEIQKGNWEPRINGTLGMIGTLDSDDVARSRSAASLDPVELGVNSPGAAISNTLDSEPPGTDTKTPASPNVHLKVPTSRKRKTRSDSLSSSRTDSTSASKSRKKGRASPSPSPRDAVSSESIPEQVETPVRKSPQSRTRSGRATSTRGRRGRPDPLPLEPLQSPDRDDQIVLQQLTGQAQLPSASKNIDSSEPRQGTTFKQPLLASEVQGENDSTDALVKSESESYTKPHLTEEKVLLHTQLEMEPHKASKSLPLKGTEDGAQSKDALLTSHSPKSAKKARVDLEIQTDHQAATPSSVSLPTGITDVSSTAQQTPVTLQIPIPSADSTAPKVTQSSSADFRRKMTQTHTSVTSNPISAIFREPVKHFEAPGYSDIVKRPMDLRTLAKKLRDKKVTTSEEYRRDLMLMLANAVMFNPEGSEVARHAKELMVECDRLVSIFMMGAVYQPS